MPTIIFYCLLLLSISWQSYATITPSVKVKSTRIAVVYDRPNKFDHSFNQAVFENGVVPLLAQGVEVKEFEPANPAQTEQGILKLARRGYEPIIGIGYATAPAIRKAAQHFPDIAFMIVDSNIDLPNVQSITFDEDHGAYLAGALAALTSKSNKIGFIGGMDIPLISKFSCGYLLGAQSIKPDIDYVENFVGSTLNAWNDPTKGKELAIYQYESGADVIFSAAGGTGLGVFQTANDYGKFAIGVDSNQNALQPGAVLTSMVKRVGRVVLENVQAFTAGEWKAGPHRYGLAGGWIDLARDKHNKFIYSDSLYSEIEELKGKIVTHDLPDIFKLSQCSMGR